MNKHLKFARKMAWCVGVSFFIGFAYIPFCKPDWPDWMRVAGFVVATYVVYITMSLAANDREIELLDEKIKDLEKTLKGGE